MGEECTLTIGGSQSLSYFSNSKNFYWFYEPKPGEEIVRLHNIVKNAVTDDRYIILGTGSTQLSHAALYALLSSDAPKPYKCGVCSPILLSK